MTTVAVLVDPPRPGHVLPRLPETSPLSEREAADLYAAMARDLVGAVAGSGGDLLVNYRPEDAVPGDGDAEAEVRELAVEAGVDEPRLEVQVGETFAGRVGNTVTHLLESEGVASAAAVAPTTPFLTRQHIDEAAMKLRRSEVVLGPATGGRVYYAGFTDGIDFADAYTDPAVGTLTDRARDVGHEVDFLPFLPVVETGSDLATAVATLNARRRAERIVPTHTAETLADLGLVVESADGDLTLTR
ncbi:TIGR04282 family arsenosugar biosynthesis glycosyltransferase [Halorarius halobius]|uniref:TIGR04282 family arsenosugar biosynthesis glycosyltransferase n=1 Tax=Halorarius halobius TaxID=2962671 RepID=UPI0020CB80E2|nr:hypothetical protein [Halorarius halobius]